MNKYVTASPLESQIPSDADQKQALPCDDYHSRFSQNNSDGWYVRGDDNVLLSVSDEALLITGRSAGWHSLGRNFQLKKGQKYQFSFTVHQKEEAWAEFIISMIYFVGGKELHKNLVRAATEKGVWTTLGGTFTPEEYDYYSLCVETAGCSTFDFSIKDIVVKSDDITYDMTLPSLAEAFDPYFDFGCAINGNQVNDRERIQFCAHEFHIMTCESEMKPSRVLDLDASRRLAQKDETAVAVQFSLAKPLLDFCQVNGIKVHGHTLVWYNATPDVFFREGYRAEGAYVSREVMLKRMENYIRQVMAYMEEKYTGLIISWDVVNEAISISSEELRDCTWLHVVGPDYVNRAFEFARKYAPKGVKLYYNDYYTHYEPKLTGICNLLDSLIADGNIDGYGFQAHYFFATPGHYVFSSPSPEELRNAMKRISEKGLCLRVSEMDVGIQDQSEENLHFQGQKYRDFMKVFMEFADRMDAVQVWGVTDDRSWRNGEYPLLFDNKARPKPAFYEVLAVAQGQEK